MSKKKSNFPARDKKKKAVPPPSASSGLFSGSARSLLLLCGLLSALVIGTFWPSVYCQFQFYDESDYLLNNIHVNHGLTWEGFHWAFIGLGKSNWVPLTWLTHMMDFQVYGRNAWGHHLTNILIHAANVSLLFLLLQRMTGAVGRSFIAAALFAVHPLRVESVTWISERKDVVSFFFGMLALLAYVRYAEESQKTGGRQERFYLLTLLLYVLSLMSKATLVTFPCLLLLLDYWPLRRISDFKLDRAKLWLFAEKIPFFLLILPASIAAKLAEQAGNSVILQPPLVLRLETALISYARYLRFMFWPENLSSNYPYPKSWPTDELWLAAAVLLGLSALVLCARRRYVLIGWLWFLGTLIPVNGIIEQVGPQAMADRYTYIPMIGILLIVVWGIKDLAESWRLRTQPLLALAAVIAILLIAVTRHDITFWRDGDIRWTRAATVCDNNWTAYANLGTILNTTDPDRALDCFQKSVEINPDYVESQRGLAYALLKKRRYDEAIEHFRIAWILNTDDPRSQTGWAVACYGAGLLNEAIYHMQIAYAIDPNNVKDMSSLADLLIRQQRFADAIPVMESICAIQTNNPEAFNKLGYVLNKNGRLDDAITAYQTALKFAPDAPALQDNLANTLRLKQQRDSMRSPTNGAATDQPPAR
jgi:tetratricopeptide (TPR) repeat protein